MPQSARLSEGGGCNRYLGNAQIDPTFFEVGLPLLTVSQLMNQVQTDPINDKITSGRGYYFD